MTQLKKLAATSFAIFLASLLVIYASNSRATESLSDSQAKALADEFISKAFYEIVLGQFSVIGNAPPFSGQANPHMGTLNEQKVRDYRVWEQVGLIHIQAETPIARQQFNWNNFLAQTTGGTTQRIIVTATEKSRPYQNTCITNGRLCLYVPFGKFTTDNIIQNTERVIGVDVYRIVMGTGDYAPTPEVAQYMRGVGQVSGRKFKMLFKYDPFATKWTLVTSDRAEPNKDFMSDTVNIFLLRLSTGH